MRRVTTLTTIAAALIVAALPAQQRSGRDPYGRNDESPQSESERLQQGQTESDQQGQRGRVLQGPRRDQEPRRQPTPETDAIVVTPTDPRHPVPVLVHPDPTPVGPGHIPVGPGPRYDDRYDDRRDDHDYDHRRRGNLIREGHDSAIFRTNPHQVVEAIEIRWTDHGDDARGRLIVAGENRSRWDSEDVESPGRVVFEVHDRISGFHIRARGDDLYLLDVDIRYARGGRGPIAGPVQVPVARGPVCIYEAGGSPQYVREDGVSAPFVPPYSGSIVRSIRVLWEDRGGDARGHLLLNGEHRSRHPGEDVATPSEVIWEIHEPVHTIRFAAEDDSIWIREVWVEQ